MLFGEELSLRKAKEVSPEVAFQVQIQEDQTCQSGKGKGQDDPRFSGKDPGEEL